MLILGGTGEAAALARALVGTFGERLRVTTALAGRTRQPGPVAGDVRIGGFGGAEALSFYLADEGVDCVVDATHPFAARISAAARGACDSAGIPRLTLRRPPWRRHPLDRWIEADALEAAAAIVGRVGRRVWLTVGSRGVAAFSAVENVHFIVRLVEPPAEPLPLLSCEVMLGRGPFNLAEERRLLQLHRIEALVCKASGGAATAAKLVAARELSLPVVMIRRPRPEPGPAVESVEGALDWIAEQTSSLAAERTS